MGICRTLASASFIRQIVTLASKISIVRERKAPEARSSLRAYAANVAIQGEPLDACVFQEAHIFGP